MDYAAVLLGLMPNSQFLIESYDKTQSVVKKGRETKLGAAGR